ncbi:MAG TPA: hypothetical protein VMT53_19400 [Terriglobales bacterium]|nr:hypothetical protein [Terriglobales bacterium]
MHIQQGSLGADIEPVYDKATYVLKHYSYSVMDSAKGNSIIFRGTAKDLKSAVTAAEKQISKLLQEHSEKPTGQRASLTGAIHR